MAASAIAKFNETEFLGRKIFLRVDKKPEPRIYAAPEPTQTLFISNLAFATTEENLFEHFNGVNGLQSVAVTVDRRSGRSRSAELNMNRAVM
jgi:RNA recognition motif-containing protein